jgi:hypothetical protein
VILVIIDVVGQQLRCFPVSTVIVVVKKKMSRFRRSHDALRGPACLVQELGHACSVKSVQELMMAKQAATLMGEAWQEYPEDALHIAVAAVNGIDVLVTWNFAHLNNPFTRMMVRHLVENAGYRCPELCSPDELLEAIR